VTKAQGTLKRTAMRPPARSARATLIATT